MSQPVKYISLVIKMLELYQNQLLTLFKKFNSVQIISEFKDKFYLQFKKINDLQTEKSIEENKVSTICEAMNTYLTSFLRPQKTSHSERYTVRSQLKSQETTRMRFTGGLKKNLPEEQINQMDEIIKSYKIEEEGPKMRMKWKLSKETKVKENEQSTIGNNNIDLLSYTIPEIENSIKRLSLQSKVGRKSPEKYDFDTYRTVDTRSQNRKKYVARLF